MKRLFFLFLASLFLLFLPRSFSPVWATTYTSQYPPAFSGTYVKATSCDNLGDYAPWYATDPSKSLTGSLAAPAYCQWQGQVWQPYNQRFSIDLGSAKTITRLYMENRHNAGDNQGCGVKNFIIQGSNSSASFDDTSYASTGWTDLTGTLTANIHVQQDIADPQYFVFSNTTAYRYYSLKLPDNYCNIIASVRRVEFQSESAPTPTPTPTISPTPTPTPISIQCPPYYTQSTAGGVTYCHQFFRSTTFPFSHECKTYNSASVDDNDDTHCGSAHIEAGNNGYQYFNFDGFSYQEATNNWKQMVYPSEITELRYYVFFANRIYDYCTPWFMTPSGIYTAQAAAVSQDDDGNEGWYRHFDLDKELFQEIQPSGIAISCDNSGDILQYNYGNDTTYNRPLTFAMLSFTYPSFASLSGSIYEATGSAEPLEIGDCEALDFACYIGRFLDWVKYLIAQFKSWLASLYQIESPYDLMVEQRDLMLEVMAYKTPFAYIIALQNIDWSTVLTSEADIDTIPIIDIPIVTYSFITHTATTTGSLYYDFNASTPLNNQALYYREIMYNFLKIIIGIIFIFWLVFTFSQQVRMIIFGR